MREEERARVKKPDIQVRMGDVGLAGWVELGETHRPISETPPLAARDHKTHARTFKVMCSASG